jgi:hypothetical protein
VTEPRPTTIRYLANDAHEEATATVAPRQFDAEELIRTCANCGAEMDERKCKLICRCGYFLSCSDYY